jgi:magnesium transporter
MLRAAIYSQEKRWSEVGHVEDVSELRKEPQNLFWARGDVRDLSPEDVALIQEEFDLPSDAVDAAVSARSRPKIEPFGDDVVAVIYELDEIDEQLEALQIAVFVGIDFLLVLHNGAERTLEKTEHALRKMDDLQLLYNLFDVVVTDYQEIADDLEEEVEHMEEIILEAPEAPVQRQLYALKQRLARLRRYVLPWSRMMEEVVENEDHIFPTPKRMDRLRGLRDRLGRIKDQVGSVEDLAQALIDLTRAEQGDRLNEQQRRLGAWAAIFGVATVIGGIYGMNFQLVPKHETYFGFWFALILIAVSSGGLFIYFRKKHWL